MSRGQKAQNVQASRTGNPKTSPGATSNQIKDTADWVSGHEPMTGAQASYLKTLSDQTHNPEVFDPSLDKAEASKRIDELKQDRDNA